MRSTPRYWSDRLARYGFTAEPEVLPVSARPRWGFLLLGALLLVLGVALTGCRTLSDQDVRMIRTSKAANLGHMSDEALPREARLIAQDNFDAWSALDYAATGAPINSETRARLGLEESR